MRANVPVAEMQTGSCVDEKTSAQVAGVKSGVGRGEFLFRSWKKIRRRKSVSIRTYLLLLIVIICSTSLLWNLMPSPLLSCYVQQGNLLEELADNEVTVGEAIFFHETSCQHNQSDVKLNSRQACAVESAALHHPNNQIFLLIAAPVMTRLNGSKNRAVHALLQYKNIKIRHINIDRYLANTPMEEILHGPLRTSSYPISHTSDVLRYTTLLKFRGTYMDLDVIVLKNLLNFYNFVGVESPRSLGAGVINFGPDSLGQQMAEECALELSRSFDGWEWGNNGPGVITRVLNAKCATKSVLKMVDGNCHGFHVLPVPAFYAFPFCEAKMFFMPGKVAQVQALVNQSSVIHYWNRVTEKLRVPEIDVDVPFSHYARQNCPKVYEYVEGAF